MKPFRDFSIKHKLTAVILLTSATALLLVCLSGLSYELLRFRKVVLQDLKTQAEIIAANSAAAVAFDDPKAAAETLTVLKTRPGIVSARIYRLDGSLFAEYVQPGLTVPQLADDQKKAGNFRFGNGEASYCEIIRLGTDQVGLVCIRDDLEEHEHRLYTYAAIMLAVLLTSLVVACLVSHRLQRLISDPLESLMAVTHKVRARKDYSLRAAKQSNDEIGFLTDEFNAMLTQVGKRDAALQASEERFRQIAENVNEVFWMSDPEKNAIIYISPAYERIWGRTCASLHANPRGWIEAIHPEDRERVLHAALSKQALGTYDEEYRVVRPDGTVRWIHDRAFPVLNSQGKVYRVTGIAEDVTDRRQLEKELLEISEREQARIGQDLHDGLCQQLVRIALTTNLLEQDLTEKVDPTAANARKISALLQDAISQARLVSRGLFPVKLEAEGLASALKEMVFSLSRQTDIRFSINCDETALVNNHQTAVHLYRITQEAVNNALKHASPQQIVIQLHSDENQIHLKISDDGTGIEKPTLRGRGMGLSIMLYRAHLIGGTLDITRNDPRGTVVSCIVSQKNQS